MDNEWIKKLWYHKWNITYLRKEGNLLFTTTRTESIMLSEASQKERQTLYDLTCGL